MSLRRRRETVVKGDSIDDFEGHLLSAIERAEADGLTADRRTRSSRTKVAVVVATACFLTLAGGSGASALLIGTTGIPILDGLLSVRQHDLDRQEPTRTEIAHGSGAFRRRPDLRPKPGSTSEPVDAPWAGGRRRGVAYVSQGGQLCFVLARPSSVDEQVTSFTCASVSQVTQDLADGPARAAVIVGSTPALAVGYARADVEGLSLSGPKQRYAVRLSESWEPEVPDGMPMRVFIAFPFGYLDRSAPKRMGGGGRALGFYAVKATLEDGRVVEAPPLLLAN